jgi:hypothetical protein
MLHCCSIVEQQEESRLRFLGGKAVYRQCLEETLFIIVCLPPWTRKGEVRRGGRIYSELLDHRFSVAACTRK